MNVGILEYQFSGAEVFLRCLNSGVVGFWWTFSHSISSAFGVVYFIPSEA